MHKTNPEEKATVYMYEVPIIQCAIFVINKIERKRI